MCTIQINQEIRVLEDIKRGIEMNPSTPTLKPRLIACARKITTATRFTLNFLAADSLTILVLYLMPFFTARWSPLARTSRTNRFSKMPAQRRAPHVAWLWRWMGPWTSLFRNARHLGRQWLPCAKLWRWRNSIFVAFSFHAQHCFLIPIGLYEYMWRCT